MKYKRMIFGFCTGLMLFCLGLYVLGVPTDISFWRGVLGIALITGANIVWDKFQ